MHEQSFQSGCICLNQVSVNIVQCFLLYFFILFFLFIIYCILSWDLIVLISLIPQVWQCGYLQKILLYYYMIIMEQYFHSDHAHGLATNEAEIQNPTPIPMPSTTPCSTKATSTSQPLIVFDSYGEKSAMLDKNTHIYLQNHRVKSKQIIRENYPNNSIILNRLV